jgi:uncharacterized protein (DUF433 family)
MKLSDFLVDHPDREIRFRGRRIGRYTIAREAAEGRAAEEIAEEYPTLSLELVKEALQFCRENAADLNEYVRRVREEIDSQAAAPSGLGVQRIRTLLRTRR